MGTVNYMSPEAIQRMNNATVLKASPDCKFGFRLRTWLSNSSHTRVMCGRWAASCIR